MDIITKIDSLKEKDIYTIEEILIHLNKYGLYSLLFIISFLSMLPTPLTPFLAPFGITITNVPFGILFLIISVHLILGINTLYIPAFIKNKTINLNFLKGIYYKKFKYYVNKFKIMCKHRLSFMINPLTHKIIGIVLIPLGILMIIPILLTNLIPGILVFFISMAVLFSDGLLLLLFIILSIITIILYYKIFKKIISYFF